MRLGPLCHLCENNASKDTSYESPYGLTVNLYLIIGIVRIVEIVISQVLKFSLTLFPLPALLRPPRGYFVIDFPLAFRTHFAKIFEDLIVPSRCEVSGMHAAGDIPMPLVGMLLPLLRKSPVTRFPLKIARVPKQDIRLL